MQGEVDKYKALIIQSIAQYWIVFDNITDSGIYCQLLVRVAPGGEVLSVVLVRSSGNPVLDRSAQTAVWKASPLPVPSDPALFDTFRELNLTARPKGITAG
jgi:colicin import membrane protein